MYKGKYECPAIELVVFTAIDIITVSDTKDDYDDDIFNL